MEAASQNREYFIMYKKKIKFNVIHFAFFEWAEKGRIGTWSNEVCL